MTKLFGINGFWIKSLETAQNAYPLLFVDAKIVSDRTLSISELKNLGFLPMGDWYPLDNYDNVLKSYSESFLDSGSEDNFPASSA